MRVLWYSVAPWFGTGYGVCMANILPRVKAAGHEQVLATTAGLAGGSTMWNGIPIVPMANMEGIVTSDNIYSFQPDVVVTLYDQWVLGQMQQLKDLYLPWVVLHYEPMEPKLYDAVKETWRQWAMCNWAARMMKDAGLNPRVVPLGVDTKVYRPLIGEIDENGRIITKEALKVAIECKPDDFVIGMVAANIDFRKHMEAQIRVFAKFAQSHKDAKLFIKTNPTEDRGGWNINRMCQVLFGLTEKNKTAPVRFPSNANDVPVTQMLLWYNAFDVFLNCSQSEGFGMTVAEANSCGIPAIVTDCSAMSEVAYGWKLPGTKELNVLYSFGTRVNEDELYAAFEEAYRLRGTQEMATLGKNAREHALQYDWDHVVNDILIPELEDWYLERRL